MKKVIFLIFGIILMNSVSAQSVLLIQRADTVFKDKDYVNSIMLYNKALKKATDTEKKYIYYQLGECYRFGNNYMEAKSWYEKAINSGYDSTIAYLRLGEMFLKTGDYTIAKTNIEKYLATYPDDNIAKIRLESCNLGLKGQKEKPLFEVKIDNSLSSTSSDYGIVYFKSNKLILASTRMEGKSKVDMYTAQGFSDMYESTYDAQKGEWSKPSILKGPINTNFNDGTFTFDPVLNYGYYMQCNGESGKKTNCNIMYSHFNENTNSWETAKLFELNSQSYSMGHPSLSSDNKTMYIVSDMPGGYGGKDIYVIRKTGDTWSQPENLGPVINTVSDEMFPSISGDTLLVFASDGHPGFGGLDVFKSTIKNGVFSKPVNLLQPINSSADDFNLIFKESFNEGLFCSNRTGGLGDDDIYRYNRIAVVLTASGNIKDKTNNKNIENATVIFKGNDGSIDSVFTDAKGNYEYNKLKPNVRYNIKATKNGYLNDSKTLNVGNELYSKTYPNIDMALIKITKEEVKIDNIYYDYDKWDLRQESKLELDKVINVLKETPEINIQISAHTDERGKKDYNIELSQKRAQSVVDYLIDGGISSSRLIAKGYGFALPIYKNAKTEEQHQMNRRTTFKILNEDEFNAKKKEYNYTPPVKSTVKPKTEDVVVENTVPKTTPTVTPTPTPTTNTTSPTSTAGKKFFIIAGSFATEQEANTEVAALKGKGFSGALVVGKNSSGKWRIAYSGFATKDEAQKELVTIKQSTNASAWMFEKKD